MVPTTKSRQTDKDREREREKRERERERENEKRTRERELQYHASRKYIKQISSRHFEVFYPIFSRNKKVS